MKRTLKAVLILATISPLLPVSACAEDFAESKSIYGKDDRVDYYAAGAGMKALSDSVVSLWSAGSVSFDAASKTHSLATVKFGDRLNLCPGEKFREQPIGAFCSGSLVGENLVMTAGHCIVDEAQCGDTKIVFGFAVKTEGGEAPVKIAEKDVYTCAKIVKRFQGAEPLNGGSAGLGPDYALVQLDRKVTGRKPLAVNRKQKLRKGAKMVVIGHPVGLPLKVAGGAKVRDASPKGYFVTDLDTFGGNSGSPVFSAKTRLIEGVLVRGDEDFKPAPGGCTTMAVYAQNAGRGEDVTKISELAAFIPRIAGEKRTKDASAELISQPMRIDDLDLQSDLGRRFNINF
ncbi:MAG: trypsin-like peptidase domain-containing protein [Elusimicrobia bacterium]|nr:trypsin-like peptidase domain-containing protein [Elusimicrobiota bacterium]